MNQRMIYIRQGTLNTKSEEWKRYLELMKRCIRRKLKDGVYFERHHIVPRCVGGSDDPDNLVKLKAGEHFLAHRLLSKIGLGETRAKLLFAFSRMSTVSAHQEERRKILSRAGFKELREALSEARKLRGATNEGYGWYTDGTTFCMLPKGDQRIKREGLRRGAPTAGIEREYKDPTKISEMRKSQVWFNDGTRSFKLSEGDARTKGLVRGRLLSKKARMRIKEGAGWTRTADQNAANSKRQKGRLRFNDGIRNYSLLEDDPKIAKLALKRGEILSAKEIARRSKVSKQMDRSYIIGTKWYTDGAENFRLRPEIDGKEIRRLKLYLGKTHKLTKK